MHPLINYESLKRDFVDHLRNSENSGVPEQCTELDRGTRVKIDQVNFDVGIDVEGGNLYGSTTFVARCTSSYKGKQPECQICPLQNNTDDHGQVTFIQKNNDLLSTEPTDFSLTRVE